MELLVLDKDFAICKVEDFSKVDYGSDFLFIGKTDEEHSVVCEVSSVPSNVTHCDKGWRGFRIQGELDFALVGILSKISTILADAAIGIFAVSTYNTDYVLVKKEHMDKALFELEEKGYVIK